MQRVQRKTQEIGRILYLISNGEIKIRETLYNSYIYEFYLLMKKIDSFNLKREWNFFLVYDIGKRESFEHIRMWVKKF